MTPCSLIYRNFVLFCLSFPSTSPSPRLVFTISLECTLERHTFLGLLVPTGYFLVSSLVYLPFIYVTPNFITFSFFKFLPLTPIIWKQPFFYFCFLLIRLSRPPSCSPYIRTPFLPDNLFFCPEDRSSRFSWNVVPPTNLYIAFQKTAVLIFTAVWTSNLVGLPVHTEWIYLLTIRLVIVDIEPKICRSATNCNEFALDILKRLWSLMKRSYLTEVYENRSVCSNFDRDTHTHTDIIVIA
jgi:hypothetical protein